jgi:hypothetical protein
MSLSKSPNKAFYRAFGLVVAGLSIGVLILALLVTTSGPRVRQVIAQNRSGDDIASVNQGLTVVFDRPIKSTDFASAIEVSPETDYTVGHRNQQLSITFNQNLLSNTEYVLTVKPVLEDDLGKQMEHEYTYEFTTAEPSFTYLEHNSGPGAMDRVIERAPLSQKRYILFAAAPSTAANRRIQHFARNDRYLAVVLPRADNTDELRVVDLQTRAEESIDIPHDVRVENLRFSPVDNQFVFITRVVAKPDTSESHLKAYDNKLYRYDIDGEQLQLVDTLNDKDYVQSALYSRDGQALLYQTLDNQSTNGEYYLTGATQTTEPILLGSYKDSGGFDRTNTKLAFLSDKGPAIYDAQAKKLQELPYIAIGGHISTPTFLHNSDELIYLWDPFNAERGDHLQLYTADADGKVEEQAGEQLVGWKSSTHSFEDLAVSPDDRYVLIEAKPKPQGGEDVGNQQSEDTRLVLYDRFDRKVVDSDTRGVEPVWNR